MWHASVSLWTPRQVKQAAPGRIERAAIALLAGAGGGREWWIWNPAAKVGHLRVAMTTEEHTHLPPGTAVADAGPSGPERPRTQPQRTRP